MKKTLLVILCIIACVFAFASCTNDTPDVHEHSWSADWSSDAENHWHACSGSGCTELDSKAPHAGGSATCTEQAKCATCGKPYGELAAHSYTKEVVDAKHLASAATCTAKATYYKSCECGANGTETFEAGSLAEHTPKAPVDENVINPTCNASGTKDVVVYCSVCEVEISRETSVVIPSTGEHNYDYAELVYKLEGDSQHSIKCNGCDVYSAPVDCEALEDDGSCETAVLCACGREMISAKTHAYTGAPVWTSADGVYTATYACDNAGCDAPKAVNISVPAVTGAAGISHTEDASAFKFSITPEEGYYAVSVKIGNTVLTASAGVYSAPVADAEISIVMSNMYEIRFVDHNDVLIGEALNLAYGSAVTAPEAPERTPTEAKAYAFAGWSSEVTAVTGNATYKATYTETARKYTITWQIGDTSTTTEVEWNALPEAPASPSKPADEQYTYTFSHWSPSIAPVAGNATYEAVFTAEVNKYTVTFVNTDGTVLYTYEAEYGATPVYSGEALVAEKWSNYRYDIFGWDSELAAVTGNVTYTVQYAAAYEYKILEIQNGTLTDISPTTIKNETHFPMSTIANIQGSDKYRVMLSSEWNPDSVDYTKHKNIVFNFIVNYSGITFSTVGGDVFLTSSANASYQIMVDKDGKVYVNGVLTSAQMADGVIAFDIARDPATSQYAQFEVSSIEYDIEFRDVSLTIGNDGAISGEGIVGQTITLPTARVWNLSEGNAQAVTVKLDDAEALVASLSVNGVALGSKGVTIKLNGILYLLGQPNYSTAGQVSFKIAYIQDRFYFAEANVNFKNLEENNGVYTTGTAYVFATKGDSKITSENGVEAYHANAQRVNGTWYDNWRLTLNKSGMDSISFYMTFNYSGAQLYAKDGIGDSTKLIHTFTANQVILVTIEKDGSVLIDGVDTGVNTASDSFALDFYNGGSANLYGSIGISLNFWRYSDV